MNKIKNILALFFVFVSFSAFAQTPVIGIGPDGITNWEDEVYVNQNVNFRVNIQNKGVSNIVGLVDVFVATVQNQQVAFIGAQSIDVDTLFSGDTISLEMSFPVDTSAPQLSVGGNTVVVWPAVFGAYTDDSIYVDLNVILPPDTFGFDMAQPPYFPDSVKYGKTDSIVFYLKNNRNAPFSGTISLKHQVISDSTSSIITKLDTVTLNNVTFSPFQSKRVAFPQTFSGPQYRGGGNTVVVWPAGTDIIASDTITGRVKVVTVTSILDVFWEGANSIKLYPNPTNDFIFLSFSNQLSLNNISIKNQLGEEVLKSKNKSIDISKLSEGVYFITVDFGEEKQRIFKLVKQ